MDEQSRIKEKMAELVAKWKDKPEPPKKSGDWFRRSMDRLQYRRLRDSLKKLSYGQQKLMTVDDQIAYCEEIGLI